MKIQSINPNYQNNYQKKNIGFKMNTHLHIEGLNCEYKDLCGPSKNILLNTISDLLIRHGFIKNGESYKLCSLRDTSTKQMRFLTLDSATIKKIESTDTLKGKGALLYSASVFATPCKLTVNDIFPALSVQNQIIFLGKDYNIIGVGAKI